MLTDSFLRPVVLLRLMQMPHKYKVYLRFQIFATPVPGSNAWNCYPWDAKHEKLAIECHASDSGKQCVCKLEGLTQQEV